MLNPIYMSEALYAWAFRTKFFRKLTGIVALGIPAYVLQHQLYTQDHSWTWSLELVGFTLLLLPCLTLVFFAVSSVLESVWHLARYSYRAFHRQFKHSGVIMVAVLGAAAVVDWDRVSLQGAFISFAIAATAILFAAMVFWLTHPRACRAEIQAINNGYFND